MAQIGTSIAVPCESADFDYQLGVYLPPGSPDVLLVVSPYGGGAPLYQKKLDPSVTVTDGSGCHWAGYVGEPAPSDPLAAALPANVPLQIELSPASSFYSTFEYQLCRGAGAPYGTFRCPQNSATALPEESRTLLRYDPSYQGLAGFRVRSGPFGDQPGESVDDEVGGEQWVLPYDAESGCSPYGCASAPGLGALPTCDAADVERSLPYMRRIVVGTSFPGLQINPGAKWVIRDNQAVDWSATNAPSSNFGFQGGACVQVRGDLSITGLGLTANEAFAPWRGISVLGSGSLSLNNSGVSFTGGFGNIPFRGAIRSSSAQASIDIQGSATSFNGTDGVYVGNGATLTADGLRSRANAAGNVPGEKPAGVWVADGSSALLLNSITDDNGGAGVRVSGSGSYANLDKHLSEQNQGFGVQADDAGEVFFARTDTGDPNPTATSNIRDNIAGNLAALNGGDMIAGILDGTNCMMFCENNILRGDDGGGVDVRSQNGSVVFAEADFWGHLTEAELVLDDDATSDIYVQPLLQQPPSARGGPFVPSASKGSDSRYGPAATVRALTALGETEAAAGALRQAWQRIETDGDRQAVFSAATILAANAPDAVLGWLGGIAAVPSEDQRWAQRALLAGLTTDRQYAATAALAETLADGDDAHARSGLLTLVRLAVLAGDEDRTARVLEQIERRFSETTEAERARALVAAVYPWLMGTSRGKVNPPDVQTESDVSRRPSALSIYPNPSSDRATLEIRLDDAADVTVMLYDMTGRRVMQRDLGYVLEGTQQVPLALDALPAGVYAVQTVTSGDRDAVRTIWLTVTR